MIEIKCSKAELLSKINSILIAVVKCFIWACGISLLIFSFYGNKIEFTKDNIICVVSSIYTFLLTVLVLFEFMYFISAKTPLESKYSDTANDGVKIYGKAKISNKEEIHEYKRNVLAVHEAGHAVMAYLRNADTIIVSASSCEPNVVTGYATFGNTEDVKSMILVNYAGAISEELIFGHYHMGSFLGSNSDFKIATELIKGYITMINPEMSKTLLDTEMETQLIDTSKSFYQESKVLLSANIELIKHLASILTEKEKLNTEEVVSVLNDFENKEHNPDKGL